MVEKKNRRILKFKTTFVQKLKHMQNVGKELDVMNRLYCWLDENIEELYDLNNEDHYLDAVGVRGHRQILLQRAREYLIDEAQKIVMNKLRRRRFK